MSKFLFVKGAAGLGNRLFTLSNAIDYAFKMDRIVYVDWTDGLFGPRSTNMFYRYFKLNNVPAIQSLSDINDIESLSFYPAEWEKHPEAGIYDYYEYYNFANEKSFIISKIYDKIKNKLSEKYRNRPQRLWRLKGDKVSSGSDMLFGRSLPDNIKEDIVIYCDYNPPLKKDIFLKNIALKDYFFKKINNIRSGLFPPQKIVGLHVRSTDKKPDRNSNFLKDIIGSHEMKNIRFFLATDNANVYNEFNNMDNVIVYPKIIPVPSDGGIHHGHYDSEYAYPEQMFEDSLIDLWLLSSCDFIWYQGNSTYSVIAQALHGKPEYQWDWNSQPLSEINI